MSFALVNLKPIVPGRESTTRPNPLPAKLPTTDTHTLPMRRLPADVLVCPKRVVPRLSALRPDEVADLFLAVQRVAAVVEEAYGGQSCTVSCQYVLVCRR